MNPEPKTQVKTKKTNWLPIVMTFIGIGFLAFIIGMQYSNNNDSIKADADNKLLSKKVIESLDTILLTNSESAPTVAKIEDPAKLAKTDDFYDDSQIGDYLILYPQRAIIYRYEENRIINFAPIVDTAVIKTNVEDPQ